MPCLGTAFEYVFGASRFEWLDAHPQQAAHFQRAMVSLSQGANEAVAAAYDFSTARRIIGYALGSAKA